jgi:hypothetical protein
MTKQDIVKLLNDVVNEDPKFSDGGVIDYSFNYLLLKIAISQIILVIENDIKNDNS